MNTNSTANIDALTIAAARAQYFNEVATTSQRVPLKKRYVVDDHLAVNAIPSSFATCVHSASSSQSTIEKFSNAQSLTTQQASMALDDTHQDNARVSASPSSRRRKPNFAEKLHAVLADKKCSSAITWLPSGKAFCMMNHEEFTKIILPRYLGEAKLESFMRRLKRWGFRKFVSTGMEHVVYSHDLFQKGRPDLCKMMNGGHGPKESTQATEFNLAQVEDAMAREAAMAEHFVQANQDIIPRQQMPTQAIVPRQPSFQFSHQGTINYEKSRIMQEMALAQRSLQEHQAFMAERYGQLRRVSVDDQMTRHMATQLPSSQVSYWPSQDQLPIVTNYQPASAARQRVQMGNMQINNSFAMLGGRPSSIMHNKKMLDMEVMRKFSSLDQDIAECEEQLAILNRLKALKQMKQGSVINDSGV